MSYKQLLGHLRRCGICHKSFSLCQGCDRGHWYCHRECSIQARRVSLKRAKQRYRSTAIGRQAHCLAQRRYRQRRKLLKDSEIHHSSAISKTSLNKKPSIFSDGGFLVTKNTFTTTIGITICHYCQRRIDVWINSKRYPRFHEQQTPIDKEVFL